MYHLLFESGDYLKPIINCILHRLLFPLTHPQITFKRISTFFNLFPPKTRIGASPRLDVKSIASLLDNKCAGILRMPTSRISTRIREILDKIFDGKETKQILRKSALSDSCFISEVKGKQQTFEHSPQEVVLRYYFHVHVSECPQYHHSSTLSKEVILRQYFHVICLRISLLFDLVLLLLRRIDVTQQPNEIFNNQSEIQKLIRVNSTHLRDRSLFWTKKSAVSRNLL